MIDELGGSISRLNAEKLIVRAVRSRQIPLRHGSFDVKIDHATGTIKFGENALEEQRTRDSLADLAKRLSSVCKDLKRGPFASSSKTASAQVIPQSQVAARVAEDQARILERRQMIAQRKQEIEDLTAYRAKARSEKEDAARKAKLERDQARAIKLAEETKKREEEKRARQKEEDLAAQKMKQLGITMDGTDDMTLVEKEKLLKEKEEKQLQQALEAEKKIQSRAKRLDAWVRATREAEKPSLIKEAEKKKIADREEFIADGARALTMAKERHAEGLVLKASFAQIQPYRIAFEKEMQAIWKKSIENARNQWFQEHEDRKREKKYERARERHNEDMRRKRQEEEASKRAEMEAKRIREAEEDNRRKEERQAQLQQQQAQEPPPTEPKWRPKSQLEPAAMDEAYASQPRKAQRDPRDQARDPRDQRDSRDQPRDQRDSRDQRDQREPNWRGGGGGGALPSTPSQADSAASDANKSASDKKIWRPKLMQGKE